MSITKRYSDIDHRWRKLASGDVNKVYDEYAINQSLFSLFNTTRGERVFNPNYGTNLPFLLFEPFDALTANSITREIEDGIRIWEGKRIEIEEIEIEMDHTFLLYRVDMSYKIKNTTQTGRFEIALKKQ